MAAEGNCAQAVLQLERLTQDEPSLFLAYLLLGQCRFTGGQYELAAAAFTAAARLSPDNVEAVFYRAACDFHLGRLEDSLSGLHRVLKIQSAYPYAHFYLGLIYQQRRHIERALAEFQESVAADPEFEEAHQKLGYLFGQLGKYPEAIDHFKKVVSLNPRNAEAHYNLALAYAKSGDAGAARPEFEVACRLNPALCAPSRR